MMKKNCIICNNVFYKELCCSKKRWNTIRRFCSMECKGKASRGTIPHNKAKVEITCQSCKKLFEVSPYRKYTARFCSVKCHGVTRVGENGINWQGGVSKVKGYHNFYGKQRKLRLRGAIGTHTLSEWEELKMQYGYMCLCCKKVEPEINLTQDHVIPLIKGGSNTIENIQPLCASCNSIKYVSIIDYKLIEALN